MNHILKYQFFIFLLFPLIRICFSQSDSLEIYDSSFVELSTSKINSVSNTLQEIGEFPSDIDIIASAEIKNKGYFILNEALSDLPGFQFKYMLDFNSCIFQKGISIQKNMTLVLIDRIQINELKSVCLCGGGQYNHSNVEHIKVVFRLASIVYNTNAVSGIVINIIQSQMGLRA
jgi:outer membrane receptor for ferrienterochelin and colicin